MTRNGTEWHANRRQAALIDRLSRGLYLTLTDGARELGIPIDTARRWHCLPEFRAALEERRRDEGDQLRAELVAQLLAQGEATITTKIGNLTADSEHVRSLESSYILDRILGKPTERTEQTIDAGVTVWVQLARRLHEGDAQTIMPVEQHVIEDHSGSDQNGTE